jgi:arginyl-tRNA--protein-N-Asp/Glu arginylyltransferase
MTLRRAAEGSVFARGVDGEFGRDEAAVTEAKPLPEEHPDDRWDRSAAAAAAADADAASAAPRERQESGATEPQDATVITEAQDAEAYRASLPKVECPYLPGHTMRVEPMELARCEPKLLHYLMELGFRRNGLFFYRPSCRECEACKPLRVPVAQFRMSRSQRRVWNRNREIRVEVGPPLPTEEKFDLFCRYLNHQHDDAMPRDRESFLSFLYVANLETVEICYWLGRTLVALSWADVSVDGLSSVYACFAPEHASRSLGTYSVLWEIEYCRTQGWPYYYLGYYVANSPKMSYKARFRPNELLSARSELGDLPDVKPVRWWLMESGSGSGAVVRLSPRA